MILRFTLRFIKKSRNDTNVTSYKTVDFLDVCLCVVHKCGVEEDRFFFLGKEKRFEVIFWLNDNGNQRIIRKIRKIASEYCCRE